jgi:hypothetical protein
LLKEFVHNRLASFVTFGIECEKIDDMLIAESLSCLMTDHLVPYRLLKEVRSGLAIDDRGRKGIFLVHKSE